MQRIIMISYDLNNAAPQEYAALKDYIVSIANSGWTKPLESVFFIECNLSVHEINEGIKKVLAGQEGTLRYATRWIVMPVALKESTGWLKGDAVEWWDKALALGY